MTYGGFGASAPIVNPVIVASCLKAYKQHCSNHAKPSAIGIKEGGSRDAGKRVSVKYSLSMNLESYDAFPAPSI